MTGKQNLRTICGRDMQVLEAFIKEKKKGKNQVITNKTNIHNANSLFLFKLIAFYPLEKEKKKEEKHEERDKHKLKLVADVTDNFSEEWIY